VAKQNVFLHVSYHQADQRGERDEAGLQTEKLIQPLPYSQPISLRSF
jgi:hypothetical protein